MGKKNRNECVNTYEVLTGKGYEPSLPLLHRETLVTSEKGQKYTLNISEKKQMALFDVDGYLVTRGQRCDKKARIVAVSFPANKSNPIMEKAKKEFAASPYHCELRGMKNGQKDKI